jgi:signal transduction histidine kinase
MPDLPDAPPRWQRTAAPGITSADSTPPLRSQVLRVVLPMMIVAAVLAVGGVLVSAAFPGWAALVGVVVALGCVVAMVVATSGIGSAVRAHARSAYAPAPFPVPAGQAGGLATGHGNGNPAEHFSMFDGDPNQRREVFSKLARRLQSLINRAIQRVDNLEREIEDPELLRGLYEIDHLATRVRRQAENLAVLGGGTPQRRSNQPVSVYAVLRSAVAEIEHYKQVSIIPLEGISLHGHAVAEIIHLLAELLENATTFTAPDAPKVVLRAHKVTAGLAVEIQDRGLGMTAEDLTRINRLLDGTAAIDLGELLQDGRIGLAVVKELAQRHGTRVQLQANIFGGIDAAVVLPYVLLGDSPQQQPRAAQQQTQQAPPSTREDVGTPAMAAATGTGTGPSPAPQTFGGWPGNPTETFGAVLDDRPAAVDQTGYPPPLPQPARMASRSLPPTAAPEPGQPASGPEPGPPPLPQRRGSHLRPELLDAPSPTKPLLGHDTNLMAIVQQGFDRARSAENEPAQSPQHHRTAAQQHQISEGESAAWPTT